MMYVLPRRKSRFCVICKSEDSTCKPEDHMGPTNGVVLSWNPEASITSEPVTIPGYDGGTVKGRFAKSNQAPVEELKVTKPRRTRAKKEVANGTEAEGSGTREQGRRGGRRRRRGAEGPERPGTIQ